MKTTDKQAKQINQDRYRQAFSGLKMEAPLSSMPERKPGMMTTIKKHALALGAAAALVAGSGVAYAQDLGGVRTMVTGWFNGEQKAVIAEPNGSNGYTFIDSQTGEAIGGGGGVAYDMFGNETPLSAQEVMEQNSEDIVQEDGRWILYIEDRAYDLMPLIQEDVDTHFRLKNGEGWQYYELVRDKNGDIVSWSGGPSPLDGTTADQYAELGEANRIQ